MTDMKNTEPQTEVCESTPAMRQFMTVKNKHPDCLIFYRMGDFFELFFDDAVTASKVLDIVLTKRGKYDGQDIPMCGVPVHAYEIYLAKLIHKGYRVAICDQIETPEEAKKRGAKGPLKRDVIRIVTRGTLTEENLLTASHNYLLVISPFEKNKTSVGFAIADISTGLFCVESVNIQDIFNALVKWNPEEIIISDNTFSEQSLCSGFDCWKKKLTLLPKARFDKNNAKHLLETVFDVITIDVFTKMNDVEIQAAGVLIDYVTTAQCCKNISLLPPKIIHSSEFLTIDASTRKNLELITSESQKDNSSLFDCVNKTVTAVGKRLLQQRLCSPILDISLIEKRLDKVELFIKNEAFLNEIRSVLSKITDIERIIVRISLGRMNPRDLGSVKIALKKFFEVNDTFEKSGIENIRNMFFKESFTEAVPKYNQLLNFLNMSLAEELPIHAKDGGFIADNFDEELTNAKDLHENINVKLMEMQNLYSQQTGINNLRIKRNNIWGIYIEVSSLQISKIPFDFLHRQTLTNATRYTTKELIELEEKINSAENAIITREFEILEIICSKILNLKDELLTLSEYVGDIDIATSCAYLAIKNKYVRPTFSQDNTIEIVDGRHPVVEKSFKEADAHFVANDCFFDNKTRKFLLLTGPNMAGKSTYLRQNAIIIIMAQCGFFVPAKKAVIGIVDRIFSRIGASDDLASGRSTFMVEMIETAAILYQATKKSFIILDEIGRGTATYDGLSIAWSVSEFLYERIQARTIFATHYHELAKLSEQYNGLVAITAQIKEWENKIIFLHKIIEGSAEKSYGIHVAQLAGLPKQVIQRATELLLTFEKETNIEQKTNKNTKYITEDNLKKKLFE